MPEPITILGFGGSLVGLAAHFARKNFDTAKEVFDVCGGFVVGVLTLPIIFICGLIIKIASPGKVFYSQIRIGKDGRPFRIYKLRTMHINAEKNNKAVWAAEKDPRVIKCCRWMRKSHVDELPQLWNVVKGEMSLIGPRPERPEILQDLEKHYPEVHERHIVRPGITGLAQVNSGYDTDISNFNRKLKSDMEYIEKRRWSLELSILLKTLPKIRDDTAH